MATAYLARMRLFSRDVRLYLAGATFLAFTSDGLRAVLFNLYLLRLGFGPKQVGLVNGAAALLWAGLALPAGAIGRRRSSRRAIIVGMTLMAAAFSLLPVAQALSGAWRTGWVLGCALASSAGVALFYVNNMPFLTSITGRQERYHAFAVEMALVPGAGFAGALLAGVLPGASAAVLGVPRDSAEAFGLPLLLSGLLVIPSVLALKATSAGVPVPSEARRSRGSRVPLALLVSMVVVAMLRFASRGATQTFFNVYMDTSLNASTPTIGAVSAIAQLLAVPAALLSPVFMARWGSGRTVTAGLLCSAAWMVLLAMVPNQAAASVGLIGSSAFFLLTTAPMRIYTQEVVPPPWGSLMSGALVAGVGLSAGGMALAGGFAIAAVGYQSVFLLGGALTAAGAVLFEVLFRGAGSARQQ